MAMIVRFSSLVARQLPPHGVRALPRTAGPALLHGVQLCSSSDARHGRDGSRYTALAAVAFGGAVAGVALQQLLFQPAPAKAAVPAREQQQEAHGAAGAEADVDPLLRAWAQEQQQQQGSVQAAAATRLQGPWVTDEEFKMVIHRRVVTKNRLMAYINSMQQRMHQMAGEAQMMGRKGEAWFQERMKELEEVVDLQAQIIIFGIDTPNARRRHLEQYGCTKWTDEALDVIKGYAPIIEIGAGHGHWQKALSDRGVDVIAFDDKSSLPMADLPNVGLVQEGNEKEICKHRKRTLLLVYPGPDNMAVNSLKEYQGTYLIYIGEPRGGVNANDEFFDALQQGWEVEKVATLDPFPDGYELLYVLKRKGQKGSGKGWWRWGQ